MNELHRPGPEALPAGTENQPHELFRLFIAVQVPEDVKREIEQGQKLLRDAVPNARIRWTNPEQFHLTLKFLGDVDANRALSLVEDLRRTCLDFTPLCLRAECVGCFPDWRRPRTIWVGIQEQVPVLARLFQAISNITQGYTTHTDRETFDGHITIGRVKAISRQEANSLTKVATRFEQKTFGNWTTDKLVLMRSELLSEGARHTCVAEIGLRQAVK